jgi:hypothetical protein
MRWPAITADKFVPLEPLPVETSGAHVTTSGARITTGKGGNWLLDPDDLTIDSNLAGTIETSLNGGTNVTEQTTASGSGDITVASNIGRSTGANFTLSAYRNIDINNGVAIANTASCNLILRADNAATGTGTVTFTGSGHVDYSASTGNVSVLYNPSGSASTKYNNPTDYSSNALTNGSWMNPYDGSVNSQLTAYMLVNNVTDLQNISTNLSGTYGLGADIDATSVSNFAYLGDSGSPFFGIIDGQGHIINNLSITSSDASVGLFGG